jgi:hypothetical protein
MNTPDQVEFAKRADRIFSPAYMRQMQTFYGRQPDQSQARFVHYTSAEAALGIIQTKRFWMRNVTAMSDYSEVRHGCSILSALFADPSVRKLFNEALDAYAPGAAEEAFKLFDKNWNDVSLNTYITSISEHDEKEDQHGRLSMWRAFGGLAARVTIVVKIPASLLNAGVLNLIFSPVSYFTGQETKEQILEVIKNVRDPANSEFLKSLGSQGILHFVFNMLLAGATCLKHEGFREEREWRLIYGPKRWPSELIDPSTEVVAGIPQLIYKIPLDATRSADLSQFDLARLFDRLIIGPTQYPWSMREAFILALTNAGVRDAENRVVMSQIPIRT